MSETECSLAVLYDSMRIMNRICWQGSLPPCMLRMSHRLSPRTGAYAQDRGGGDFRIVFNAVHARYQDDSVFLQIMAHEMIHLWQYSLGRKGGHGRDFCNEQIRLGLIQGREIPQDSPMGYVLFLHRLKELQPAEAARKIAADPAHGRTEINYFYRVCKGPNPFRGG